MKTSIECPQLLDKDLQKAIDNAKQNILNISFEIREQKKELEEWRNDLDSLIYEAYRRGIKIKE